jgi:hypothetical protein
MRISIDLLPLVAQRGGAALLLTPSEGHALAADPRSGAKAGCDGHARRRRFRATASRSAKLVSSQVSDQINHLRVGKKI